MSYGLGRKESIDQRDLNFPMKAALPKAEPLRDHKYWNSNGIWLDQGETSSCVGHAWTHAIEDGPVMYKAAGSIIDPYHVYREAQKVDEWDGENYDGTSVRAGAKVLQAMGFISAYTWAFDLETTVKAIITTSPVIVGTDWFYSMFHPDKDGVIKLEKYSSNAGGHAYLINGVNRTKGMFRIKNSWGRGWSKGGHAYISFEDFERLMYRGGEICLPIEVKKQTS